MTLELSISQDELATLSGATRQTVNLEVKAPIEDGVLRARRRRLQPPDVSALRALGEAERQLRRAARRAATPCPRRR